MTNVEEFDLFQKVISQKAIFLSLDLAWGFK